MALCDGTMNVKGEYGRICRKADFAGAARTRDIVMNEHAVHMECSGLGTSRHKLYLILFRLHSNLHTAIVQLYHIISIIISIVLILYLIIYCHYDINTLYRYDTNIIVFTSYVWQMQVSKL